MKKIMKPFATEAQEAHKLTSSIDTLAVKTNIKAGTDGLARGDEQSDIADELADLVDHGQKIP